MSDAPTSSGGITPAAAEAAVAANVTFSTERLARVIEALYGDAGLAGAGVAARQIAGPVEGDFADVVPTMNWDTWKAGDPETAGLVRGGGLKELLDHANITVQNMTDSAMVRMGNVLAEGIEAGDSNATIARNMRDIIADPKRAMVIARTEVARAMGTSTLDSFEANSIDQWTWNPTDGACPICLANEANGPYDVGSGPTFPAHPSCRCDPRAVLDVDKGILAKVGPKGYIHGWIKVGPGDDDVVPVAGPVRHFTDLSEAQKAGIHEGVQRVKTAAAEDPLHEHGLLVHEDGSIDTVKHGDLHGVNVIGHSEGPIRGSVGIHSHPDDPDHPRDHVIPSYNDAVHSPQWGQKGEIVLGSGRNANQYAAFRATTAQEQWHSGLDVSDIKKHITGAGNEQEMLQEFKNLEDATEGKYQLRNGTLDDQSEVEKGELHGEKGV